ncbi:MAG: hypothetical protein JSS42_09500 [Proteobacteria bacterium]|nr:hypothetical protein [Pseudomonadota bacterium]
MFNWKRKRLTIGAESRPDWLTGRPLPLDHPSLPPGIAKALQSHTEPGNYLHRVDCDGGVEWWLFDRDDNLVEAFWSE